MHYSLLRVSTWRLARAACLPLLAAGALWSAAPPAHAQSSTLIYGSDTEGITTNTPPVRTFGYANQIGGGSLELGSKGQAVPTYGAVYDPNPVDVSAGFVVRLSGSTVGSNGNVFVVKNPSAPDYLLQPDTPPPGTVYGLGATNYVPATGAATGLRSTLDVAFITYRGSPANHIDRNYKEVQVFASDANGAITVLADVTGLSIDGAPVTLGSNTLQIRDIPRFNILDVYIGSKLIVRVPNVDLNALGIASGGMAELGMTSGTPYNVISSNTEFFPFQIDRFSVSNQLVFGGFGANYYEDRFPFEALRQSLYNTSSDTVEYENFIGTCGNISTPDLSFGIPSVFSVDASAFASYDIGVGIDASATGGTADIEYPLFLDMLFPAQYSVDPGKTFTLPMSFYPDAVASLKTTSPSADVKASFKCITKFGVDLDTTVLGNTVTSGNLFTAKVNLPETIIFDAKKLLSSGLIPDVNGGVNYSGAFQGSDGASGDKIKKTPSAASEVGGFLKDFVTFNLTIPDLSTSGSAPLTGSNATHLVSTGTSPFLTLNSDFTNAILGFLPGVDILTQIPFFNNDYTLSLGGQTVELGTHFCDISGSLGINPQVDYDFTPGPQVYLTLDPPADPNNPADLGPYSLDPATGKLLSPPTLTMPASGLPLQVTPYVVLKNPNSQFKTVDSFNFTGGLSINPLSFSYAYNDTSFSTDPTFGFPLSKTFTTPVYTAPAFVFPAGTSTGGAANAVPFQDRLYGKSFTLFATSADNPALDRVTASSTLVLPSSAGTLPITLATEHASDDGSVVWDYDGVTSDPQTTLVNRVYYDLSKTTAEIPDTLLTAQGLHTITVLNREGNDTSLFPSNPVTFTINAPVPVLSALSAGSSPLLVGGAGFPLRLIGAKFSPPVAGVNGGMGYPGSVALWNGKPLASTFSDTGHLSAVVPAALLASAGVNAVTVYTSGPGGGTSRAITLTVGNPAPTLSGLSDTQIKPGLSALTLTLAGANFVPGATVRLAGSASAGTRKATFVSSTALKLDLTASDLTNGATYTVQVSNPAPGGGTSGTQSYTVGVLPAPAPGFYFVPKVTNGPSGYEVRLTVFNITGSDVKSVLITSETVGGDSTGKNGVSPSLPAPLKAIVVGTLPANSSVTPTSFDTFPVSLGAPGKAVLLTVQGSAGGLAFTSRLRVVLPPAVTN